MDKKILLVATFLGLTAIVLGAFGAHALKERISAERLVSFETGVRYQMYHGLAFLILANFVDRWKFNFRPIFLLLSSGILFFSCSIYGLALQEIVGVSMKFLGPITPIGGLLLICGWALLGIKISKS